MSRREEKKRKAVEALKEYREELQKEFQEKLIEVRENLSVLLKEGIHPEYKLCLDKESLREGYAGVSETSVRNLLWETDLWQYNKAIEDYPQRNIKLWNTVFRHRITTVEELNKLSDEYEKIQKILNHFEKPQEGWRDFLSALNF